MAGTKAATLKVAQLDDTHQRKFEEYCRKQELARRGNRANEDAKKLKAELVEAFGESPIAVLPDGRQLQRVQRSGHRNAAKAYDYSWWELNEVG